MVLAHDFVVAPGATPRRTALVLHGILGSRRNWRTFARRLAPRWPDHALVLVDLRNHGDSHGLPAPHTLTACADDLARLAASLPAMPDVVIGHSFGGKVALAYARDHGEALATAWVLDALPGPAATGFGEVVAVLDAIRATPQPLPSRDALVAHLSATGLPAAVVGWLTTSVYRAEDGLRWRFDLPAVEEMLADYAGADLLPFLDETVHDVHLVRSGRSDRWTPDVLARLARCAPTVAVHVLPDAGHWLHVDDPDGLLALLAPASP